MNLDILKNPVLIGLVAGVIAYLFFYLRETEDEKRKKGVFDNKNVKFVTPIAVAVIVWFISFQYLDERETPITIPQQDIPMPNIEDQIQVGGIHNSLSDSVRSFHLVGKGITLPSKASLDNLPDVFLETY